MRRSPSFVFASLFIALAASMVACGSADAGGKVVSASDISTVTSSKGGFTSTYDVAGYGVP